MTNHEMFKNISQSSKQTRTTIDISGATVSDNQAEETPNTLPPRYTELPLKDDSRDAVPKRNNPYPNLTRVERTNELKRHRSFTLCLLEILAVTFSTDCQRIKAALVKLKSLSFLRAVTKDPYSILNKKDRAFVTEFCILTRTLQEAMSQNRWLLVCGRDKDLINKMVLEPVRVYQLNLDYVLEVFGRYKRVEGCQRPESTLVDY
jgi:hypothetical protein